jgi:hypothetical protein
MSISMLNVDMDISMNIIREQGNKAYNMDIYIHAAWTWRQHGHGQAAWAW